MEINRWAQLAAEGYGADRELLTLIRQAEKEEEAAFREIDEISAYNQLRLLQIFQEQGVTDFHLGGSTERSWSGSLPPILAARRL